MCYDSSQTTPRTVARTVAAKGATLRFRPKGRVNRSSTSAPFARTVASIVATVAAKRRAMAKSAHDWQRVTAPNGDTGWQCSRCKLTAISLPVPASCEQCPYVDPYRAPQPDA